MLQEMVIRIFAGVIFLLVGYTPVLSADYHGKHQWKRSERTLKNFVDEGFDIVGMTYGEELSRYPVRRVFTTTYLLKKKNTVIRCRESISGIQETRDMGYSVYCSELTEVTDVRPPNK